MNLNHHPGAHLLVFIKPIYNPTTRIKNIIKHSSPSEFVMQIMIPAQNCVPFILSSILGEKNMRQQFEYCIHC